MKIVKKLLIIFLFLFLTGCSNQLATNTTQVPETVTATSIVTETVEDTAKINELNAELAQYKHLIASLNELLENVYYVYQKKSDGSSSWGTGFSLKYKSKFYLITAGHAVNGEYGIFKNLGFEDNNGKWIYPKLLDFNNDYINRNDYAIFYSDKILDGLNIDNENDNPEFIIGNEKFNTIKDIGKINIAGESGSPIIDIEGEIIGILTTDIYSYYTDIDLVIEAIDNLE